MNNDINCYGGGVDFKSPLYPMKYSYYQYVLENPVCKLDEDIKYAEKFMEHRSSFEKLAKHIISENKCPKLSAILKSFMPLQEATWKHVEDITDPRLIHIEEVSKRLHSDIHLYQAEMAKKVKFCGVSDVATKVWPYWYLITKLKEMLLVPPVPEKPSITHISNDGETAETCHNIYASGSEDLKNFSVKLPKNNLESLNFFIDAYAIKDQLIVSNMDTGEEIFDSGCISDKKGLTLDEEKLKDIEELKFEVVAKCNGDYSTYWTVEVDCVEKPSPPTPKIVPDDCRKYIEKLIIILDDLLQLYEPIQNHYWNKVICYNEYDAKLKTELEPAKTELKIFKDKHECKVCPPKLPRIIQKPEQLASAIIFKREPRTEEKPLTSSLFEKGAGKISTGPPSTSKLTQFDTGRNINHVPDEEPAYELNKNQFQFIKDRYCNEENKNRIELFDIVSRRHCLSAYPVLLPSKR